MSSRPFIKKFRVYYDATDALGWVYHAEYLKYAEQARTDFLEESGLTHTELLQEEDLIFVVHTISIKYHKPAKLDDKIEVRTFVKDLSGSSIYFEQDIYLRHIKLAAIHVRVASISGNGVPKRLPERVRNAFEEFIS